MSEWKSSEIHYLKENYATEDTKVMAQRLNRPRKVVAARANSLGLRKEKKENNNVGHGLEKMERVLTLIVTLTKSGLTVKEIAKILDTTTRTTYRYIQLVEASGFNIKECHGRYFIHGCPVCGHTTNNH